jgi:acetyl esterase/lipase
MADSVACAIHFVRARAAELGSDDPVVAVAGFSLGGGLAAHVALSGTTLEAGWELLAFEGGHSVPLDLAAETIIDAIGP